jgi:hypothetical protein
MSDTSRFVIWIHRRPDSLFGAASNPVIRNGALLFYDEEACARAECDRLNAHLRDPHIHYTVQLTKDTVQLADTSPQTRYNAGGAAARDANVTGCPK